MSSLNPQTTGTHLGSRNPFLGLLTPQTTGTSNYPSASNATPVDASDTVTEGPQVPPKDRPSPPREATQSVGGINSPDTTAGERTESTPLASVANSRFRPPSGPPPPLPPRAPNATVTTPNNETVSARSSTLDVLEEELPPAYTPGPNSLQGEQSVEFGPLRPFQNERTRPAPQPVAHDGYPGLQASNSGRIGASSVGQVIEGLVMSFLANSQSSSRPSHGLGSFSSSSQFERRIPPPPSMPGSHPGFVPPVPNRQQVLRRPTGRTWAAYPGQMNRSATPEPQPLPPNDGKPTVRPIPGHPLLRDNKILIYPLGHECRKCFNKGFRPLHASTFDSTPRSLAPGDPSHPCRRCWHRYAQPYNTALAQEDWTNMVDKNYQRPISDPAAVSPDSLPARDSVLTATPTGDAATLQPQYTGAPLSVSWMQSTPSGRRVLQPGDPRIGGRLCARCHGSGRIRIFILDSETCPVCRGIGRTF